MTWGIRRIAFTLGAMLLVGGWVVTGYVDACEHAAGAAVGERRREGEQETMAAVRPSTPVRTDSAAGPFAGVTPPSSWLYALGGMIMMGGAGLMALTVPWRGAPMAAAAEAAPQQRYVSPPPPTAPVVQAPSAASFPGVPPLQQAQSMASSPLQPPHQEPAGKAGVKPLRYKKGA